ncbi:MAG TPA: amino acid ABC transporter substrate-binding protein [Alphaproteobacteria bacterium]|nr:amino acid ABC transporter substrate-binding protein [Alphaproteobacteria bacterium]
MRRLRLAVLLLCLCLAGGWAKADRLEAIKARGHLTCGVLPGVAGFAVRNADGSYSGFDIDTCRAIAAAIFGKPDRVKFVQADDVGVFRRVPEVDVVIRRLTWSVTRETPLGLMFGPVTYYDGQGLLVPAGTPDAKALAGKTVCVEQGEGWVGNLARYAQAQGLDLKPLVAPSRAAAIENFTAGACAAYSGDKTMLASIRAGLPKPDDYAILPDEFSKEPLAPLVRQGDDRFFEIVRWTVFALIEGEELGVSSRNSGEMRRSDSLEVRRFLGIVPGNGAALGLKESWAADSVSATGNYGEMFARNLGPLGLDRGLNKLWKDGGLMYAPPLR